MTDTKERTTMFVFSKPFRDQADLFEWKEYFDKRGIGNTIREREDGLFDLLVAGEESQHPNAPAEPIEGPCLYCGSKEHLKKDRYSGEEPRFKYCSNECQELHRNEKCKKMWGVTWDVLIKLGIAPREVRHG